MRYGNQLGGDGCHPVDGCQDGTPYGGSLFPYLAANVLFAGTDVRGGLIFDQLSGGEQPGEVTYGEAFTVQPFGNTRYLEGHSPVEPPELNRIEKVG